MTTETRHIFMRYVAPFVGALLAFLVAFGIWPTLSRWVWPATRYYELISVEIGDAVVGDPVPLRAVRVIKRPFAGEYNVSIRQVGHSAPICNGGMDVDYKTGLDPVAERDLEWWTAGAVPACMGVLQPGRYVLTTCIYVKSPEREICKDSNPFTIRPRRG